MPILPIEILTIIADVVIFIFVGYYAYTLRKKEKEVDKIEKKEDADYHKIVDNALTKERQILEDATQEADEIISSAEYVRQSSKEAIDHALQELVKQIQKESISTATGFMTSYSDHLKNLATSSLTDFEDVSKALQADLQKQIKDFRESLLPDLEKELDEYKKMRLKQSEETIAKIVQKASSDIFNKSISLEDHQKLLIASLEKAKAEGVFD